VVIACNFTPVPRYGYRVGVPSPGYYRERINTDAAVYGGSDIGNSGGITADDIASHGRPCSLALTLPPLATVIFEHQPS
jgi:1,4-alpha-glucan branching enzyme